MLWYINLEILNQWLYHRTDDTHTQCMSTFNVGTLMCNTNFTVLVTATQVVSNSALYSIYLFKFLVLRRI